MIIIEKNAGTKIPYSEMGTKLMFNDELMLNLAKIQKDDPVHKDICFDYMGDLVIGAEAGRYYVAEIDIPAIEYTEEWVPSTREMSGEQGMELVLHRQPLDMSKVKLTLWSIDDKHVIE